MTSTTPPDDSKVNRKCSICGFVLAGSEAPNHCPECGARRTMFEASDEPPHGIPHNPFQPVDREQGGEVLGPSKNGCLEND